MNSENENRPSLFKRAIFLGILASGALLGITTDSPDLTIAGDGANSGNSVELAPLPQDPMDQKISPEENTGGDIEIMTGNAYIPAEG